MFSVTETLSFVQNPRLNQLWYVAKFPAVVLSLWLIHFFPKGDFFSQGTRHMFLLLPPYFCSLITAFAWFVCVVFFFLLSLTENKGRTLEITRNFLFLPLSFWFSVFLLLVCPCTCNRFLISFAFFFAIFQSLATLKGFEQRKCSSTGPSLGLIW